MPSGRATKLVGQAGEYLVAAELARRGLISTTFTGNVPDYDIICLSASGKFLPVQVKTSKTGSWHLQITRFCHIDFDGDRQCMRELKAAPVPDLVTVFVVLADSAPDRFFVLPWDELRRIVIDDYSEGMSRRDWIRPKNPQSLHCALLERQIPDFRDAWGIIDELVGPTAVQQGHRVEHRKVD
jgi:hypothetical protein